MIRRIDGLSALSGDGPARIEGAARWWRAGDVLYYLGLLSAVLAPVGGFACAQIARSLGPARWWALAFAAGIAAFCLGVSFKRRSDRIAERDGIDTRV